MPTLMALLFLFFLLASTSVISKNSHRNLAQAQSSSAEASVSSRISIVGAVYCDTCFDNSFSTHSYFMPGADVHIQCRIKAYTPRTAEVITLSVNRTTDEHGVYRLDIPSVDGIDCVHGPPIQSFCQASLITNLSPECSILASRSTTEEISVKSKQSNHCIYSFTALSFRPRVKNDTLCRKRRIEVPRTSTSSRFFLPTGIPEVRQRKSKSESWIAFPERPTQFHKPRSSLFSLSSPPVLPLPFQPLPPFTPTPTLFYPPSPPSISLGDPRPWIPHVPVLPQPSPPQFNPLDPRTWIPSPPSSSTNP